MSEPSELERVLAGLDTRRTLPVNHEVQKLADDARDAARLLRELARDFDDYARHESDACDYYYGEKKQREWRCCCGLDKARERWRLPK